MNSGTNSLQKILFSLFSGKFKSSITPCAITTYTLVTLNSDGTYSDYTGTDVYLDSSFNLYVDTSAPMSQVLYLEASNPTAVSLGYLPLYLTVSNYAPFFVYGPPSGATISYDYQSPSTSSKYTYNLPAYSDNEDPTVSISVSGLTSFMTIDSTAETIVFDVSPDVVGSYEVTLTLTDTEGLQTSA
jgi:hypothetical protein